MIQKQVNGSHTDDAYSPLPISTKEEATDNTLKKNLLRRQYYMVNTFCCRRPFLSLLIKNENSIPAKMRIEQR